jgi:hypothetical protein
MAPAPGATLRARVASVAAAACVLACAARASARCRPHDERPHFMAHSFFVSVINPLGAELNLRLGLCQRLYGSQSEFFDRNHMEVGLSSYVSPVHFFGGAYVQAAPTSFWFFRFEAHALGIWSLPMEGAGYYARPSYDAPYRATDLPVEQGASAGGIDLRAINVFRGRVPVGGKWSMAAFDAFFLDHPKIGNADYYVSLQHDLIVARSDLIVANEGTAVVGYSFSRTGEVRLGMYDALRYVPGSGDLVHQFGGFLGLAWDAPGRVAEGVSVFARLGGYTNHPIRAGEPSTLLGIAVDWDVLGLGREGPR